MQVWYQLTSDDPADRAHAFVTAGNLTAANWDRECVEPL
jgi:hypothetical protein